ncbi:MAG: hypothetical protein IPI44_21100 [Sulfuritalea sp.]|nr:hypothetical protein [Sulfuritalea sp.]
MTVKNLALSLPSSAWRKTTWREGTNASLSSRLCRRARTRRPWRPSGIGARDEEWLLIARGQGANPNRSGISCPALSAEITRKELVKVVKMRWRIERDYQELKQEFGLDNFEGPQLARLPSPCHAVHCGVWLLVGERLVHGDSVKKTPASRKTCLTRKFRFPDPLLNPTGTFSVSYTRE